MALPTATERAEIEFRAFQDALGSIPPPLGSDRVLMLPSSLNTNTGKLTLGEPRGTATRAIVRFEKADVEVPLTSDEISPAALAAADPNYLTYGSLIGVELADASKLLKEGIVLPASSQEGGNAAITSQFKLGDTNPGEQPIISTILPLSYASAMQAGSTFRITVRGTIQADAAVGDDSGKLLFKPYIGAPATGTVPAPPTFAMDSQTTPVAQSSFFLEVDATVRTSGSAGTYVSYGYGRIEFTSPIILKPPSTIVGAPVDTTAASAVVKLTAQWEKPKANNILLVETATIEQVA